MHYQAYLAYSLVAGDIQECASWERRHVLYTSLDGSGTSNTIADPLRGNMYSDLIFQHNVHGLFSSTYIPLQVPMDQAKSALDMISHFVEDKSLDSRASAVVAGQAVHPHSQAVARPLRIINS